MSAGATLLSVSVGAARPLRIHDSLSVLSGIVKRPVDGPVAVGRMGLAGDEQADLSAHGGLQKAVYAYPSEHLGFWQAQRQQRGLDAPQPLPPGFLGENLLLRGLLERELWVGDELRFAGSDCVLRITAPREPCYKLNAVMGFVQAARLMAQQRCTGFYLAVDAPGTLAAGMAVQVAPGPRRLSLHEAVAAKWAKHRND